MFSILELDSVTNQVLPKGIDCIGSLKRFKIEGLNQLETIDCVSS